MKGSLNTFLNAFTYPDRTCYPVASTNTQDYYNLVDVSAQWRGGGMRSRVGPHLLPCGIHQHGGLLQPRGCECAAGE